MWKTAGEALTLSLDFTLNGQFVVPDPGSVLVTLRDNDGMSIEDWLKKPMPDPITTSFHLLIPAEINTLAAGRALETRYVRMEYKVNGYPCTKAISYRLSPFLPITASTDGVRARLGATENELPDDDLDIYGAYYTLLRKNADVLPGALISSNNAALAANNAIELRTALDQMPGLSSKLLQSESQDNATFARMKVDFQRLQELLESQLDYELQVMNEIFTGLITSDGGGTMMVLTTPTNVITG